VLFHRRPDDGGAFFLDRFETTRGDWRSWLVAQGLGPADQQADSEVARVRLRHPVTGVPMTLARRFAAWRFCRLQRLDEWEHARTAGGRYPYPWGDNWHGGTWCNSRDLGLDRTTPVGTFPASDNGLGACDLVGNVQEWTETVPLPPLQFRDEDPVTRSPRPPIPLYMPGETEVRHCFGLAAWQPAWLPAPTVWMVQAAPRMMQRLVVGGHYRSQIPVPDPVKEREPFPTVAWWRDRDRRPLPQPDPMPNPVPMYPEEYDAFTGLRLATDPEALLVALLEEREAPDRGQARLLRWFLSRAGHRQVLRDAWPRARRQVTNAGPLLPVLHEELAQ